jgi:cytochrome c553|tara:strand:- start:135 stop:515 length:381 start_codon:yes stop_codon:yes gene_type:complete
MKKLFIVSVAYLVLNINHSIAGVQLSETLKAGKEKAITICSGCHGINGKAESGGNSGAVPNIYAQQRDYLTIKLKAYKSGELKHPQMTMIAQMLTDDDIDNVAEWYSRIKVKVFDPEIELSDSGQY